MTYRQRIADYALLAAVSVTLTGCGNGTKLLKQVDTIEPVAPMATTTDDRIAASLDWVLVRNAPGSWARNADWDEYRLQVANNGETPVTLIDISVIDAQGVVIASGTDRKTLVKRSKEIVRRYDRDDIEITAGLHSGAMSAMGAGIGAAGYAIGSAAASSAVAASAGAGAAVGAGAVVATGALIAAPVLVFGGIARASNNYDVAEMMVELATPMPLAVPAGEALPVTMFFPLSPSPRYVEVHYEDADGPATLRIDTGDVLRGLHLAPQPYEEVADAD